MENSNNRFRFRAWDKKEKHFVYFELFMGANNHTPPIYEDAELLVWQQYTGLKDKNGKEIYCGDIMAIKGIDDDQEYYYEVYQNDAGTFMACNELINDLRDSEFERCLVYSNKYDNPELLNN